MSQVLAQYDCCCGSVMHGEYIRFLFTCSPCLSCELVTPGWLHRLRQLVRRGRGHVGRNALPPSSYTWALCFGVLCALPPETGSLDSECRSSDSGGPQKRAACSEVVAMRTCTLRGVDEEKNESLRPHNGHERECA